MEQQAAAEEAEANGEEPPEPAPFLKPTKRAPALDEEASPTAGRRFTRA
jgi:hypothetical protein